MIKEILLGDRLIRYDLQRKKVKNINIRIKRDLSVHVSAHSRVPQQNIEAILIEKADFILGALRKYEGIAKEAEKSYIDPNSVLVFGRRLPIVTVLGKKNQATIEDGQVALMLKDITDASAREKAIKIALDSLLRDKIEEICREIYPSFQRYCPEFPTLKFRNMKTRWGSCNYQKDILTFNYDLVHAPVECVKFVIYHEFTHFIHPNHSAEFYKSLSTYVPDHKYLKKELEKYRTVSRGE